MDAVAVLPALSTAAPETLRSFPSCETVVARLHEATPESLSAQANETVTSVLYQPFELGDEPNDALMDGGVLSIFTKAVVVAE